MSRLRQMSERYWERRVLDLATFLAEEASSNDLFTRFLAMLSRDFPGSSSLLDYDAEQRRMEFASNGVDAPARKAYSDYFHAINPYTRSILDHRLYRGTYVGSHIVDQSLLRRTEFYSDWLRPRGESYLVVISIGFDDGGRAGLPIYRGDAQGGDYTTDDARRLDMLRRFLKNTLILRRLRSQHTSALPLVAPRKNGLDACNDAAEHLLSRDGIHSDSQQVPLQPLKSDCSRVVVPSSVESSRLIFSRRYGLSPRESEVAALLCEGLSYNETAARLGLSYHTVNAHVKSLLRKLDLSSIRHLPRLVRDDVRQDG